MVGIDKAKIIEAIQRTDDERILFAINRLLLIEEDKEIPEWQKKELDKRNERLESGREKLHDWNYIKDEIQRLD